MATAPSQLAFAAAEDSRRVTTESDVSPLPRPPADDVDEPVAFAEATATATPQERAELVAMITDAAGAHRINAYGALSTSTTTTAIVTSAGLRRSATSTQASLVSVARGDDGGGYASRHSPDIDMLDVPGLAAEVVDTCERNRGATAIGPGDYEVILSPVRCDRPARTPRLGWVQRTRGAGAPKLHAHRREADERHDHHPRRRADPRDLSRSPLTTRVCRRGR